MIERTVLFADLRGSTALYETLGNSEATAVVTQSVALLARVVLNCGGTVVKTLGDGLMAMFERPEAAVRAADEMHDSLERIGTAAPPVPRPGPPRPALKLQVGVAIGEVVEVSGDFFGDAVNVAARLIDHAGDNETLVTVNVRDALDAAEALRFRSLDRLQLRGRAEAVHVGLLEAQRFSDMEATVYGDILRAPEPEGIRLAWLDMSRIYAPQSLPVILGRSPQATWCIDDSRVSRSHARIDWHGGTFQLTDLSFNGTYVRFAGDSETVSLRRGGCTLHGSGLIGLGSAPLDPTAPTVRFEVMRFSETEPQPQTDIEP
jgi:class 3 adenylate cyclase